jgi:hypothetical protein
MAAMVTAAAPEGAKAARSVFRIAIVAALCADLSHPSCNWIYQLLKYNIAVACCQKVVAILVDDRTIHHISWGTWACEAPDDALFGS